MGSCSKIPLLIAREDFIPLLFHNPRASVSFKRKILTLGVWGSVSQSCAAQVLSLFFSFPLSDSNINFLEHFGFIV